MQLKSREEVTVGADPLCGTRSAPGPSRVARSVPSRHCECRLARLVILSGKLCFQLGETCKKKKRLAHVSSCEGFVTPLRVVLACVKGFLRSPNGCERERAKKASVFRSGSGSCFMKKKKSSQCDPYLVASLNSRVVARI